MRIDDFRWDERVDTVRASATVIWEDCDRGTQDVYFEMGRQFADSLSINPHAFLVASILPAMRHGERRVAIDAEICPELKLGLGTAMSLLQFWYGDSLQPVTIEAKPAFGSLDRQKPGRAAFCFTGGVDSLATLRVNRLHFAEQHPGYFRDGLLIFGLEVDRLDSFQCVMDVLSVLAQDAAVTMIPMYTNVRDLDEDWSFWSDEFEAAVLASVAHALHRRLSSAAIGSSFDYPYLHPHGSHPLLDPNYSSSDVQIRHDGVALSRLAKTRLLADWDVALKSLRVCNRSEDYRPGIINCGRCEKCLRTLAALLIVGKLDKAEAFACREVTPELIAANVELSKTNYPFWAELVVPLEEKGRHDLARAVKNVVARYQRKGSLVRSIRRFDRLHLNGALHAIKQTLAPSPRSGPATSRRSSGRAVGN
jgi:hypothetical protein